MSLRVMILLMATNTSSATDAIFFSFDANNFTTTGIPAAPKDKPAYPSETQIDCFHRSMSCVEATGDFYVGNPHVSLNYLTILKWDRNGIVATSDGGICMSVTMLVVFAEKRFRQPIQLKQVDEKVKGSCKFFGAEKTEMDVFGVRGSPRWNKEHTYLPIGESD